MKENDGYFPVKVESLLEGTVVHAGCPVLQITAEEPYAHLCTFMETILTHVWCASEAPGAPARCGCDRGLRLCARFFVSRSANSSVGGSFAVYTVVAALNVRCSAVRRQVSHLRGDAQPPRQGAFVGALSPAPAAAYRCGLNPPQPAPRCSRTAQFSARPRLMPPDPPFFSLLRT